MTYTDRISTFSDEDLRADLVVAHELRDEYGMNTSDGAVGGGVIGGWIAQALRMRPRLLQYPVGPCSDERPAPS
jgi:hypothetical protein